MRASEHLTAAKISLIENGWCKGTIGFADGSRCAGGAIIFTADDYRATLDIFAAANGFQRAHIGGWNDARDRTFSEVMEAFDEAILLAKEQEASL